MLTAADLFPVGLALGYPVALTLDTMPVSKRGPMPLSLGTGGTQARRWLEVARVNHAHNMTTLPSTLD